MSKELDANTTLSHYRIVSKIGAGGMGEEKYAKKETSGRNVAAVYAGLGDKDKAFEWLEKDFQTRGDLMGIRWQIPYESLRDDSRYKDLLKRMNLPE